MHGFFEATQIEEYEIKETVERLVWSGQHVFRGEQAIHHRRLAAVVCTQSALSLAQFQSRLHVHCESFAVRVSLACLTNFLALAEAN